MRAIFGVFGLAMLVSAAQLTAARIYGAQAAQPVPAAQAFRFMSARTAEGLSLNWAILPGHYLYRDSIEATGGDGGALKLATPPGERKADPNFGDVEIYREMLSIAVPAADLPAAGRLRVTYQGCAESGFCYAPIVKIIDPRTLAVSEE
jgi:thiol:disulfide interchange protein DsbD